MIQRRKTNEKQKIQHTRNKLNQLLYSLFVAYQCNLCVGNMQTTPTHKFADHARCIRNPFALYAWCRLHGCAVCDELRNHLMRNRQL